MLDCVPEFDGVLDGVCVGLKDLDGVGVLDGV